MRHRESSPFLTSNCSSASRVVRNFLGVSKRPVRTSGRDPLFFYPSRMVGAARKKRVKVPDGTLGILLKKEPDLGLVVYASPDVKIKPCRVAPVVGCVQ